MITLGIDPGLAVTGWGVLRHGQVLAYGQIATSPALPLAERIEHIVTQLDRRIRRLKPTVCAVETLFFRTVGARSVILTAQVRGALFLLLARRHIPVTEITPATLKLVITGNGRAAKSQVQYMVRALLKIRERIPAHAADALAAAYCLELTDRRRRRQLQPLRTAARQ